MEHKKSLSHREEEVVTLLMHGNSNKQIAAALHISERTVEFHLKNIYTKLHVNSRIELILKLGKTTGVFTDNPVETTVDISDKNVHNGKQTDSQNNTAQSLKKIVPMYEKEFAMNNKNRTILILIVASMGIILIVGGIILIVGGIITDKNGAVVVGLSVSAVGISMFPIAIYQWIQNRKQPKPGNREPQQQ
jgi:DNA-binding CsgD family transcriptional regulator